MPYIGNITQDFNVSNAMLDTDSVTSIKIVDGTIEGADIAANLDLSDSQKIRFGAGNDLQIYHDGSNSRIENSTGSLVLNSRVLIKTADNSESIATFNENGAVELYYDNNKKLETTNLGVTITGTTNSKLSAANGTLVLESTNNDVLAEASDDFIVKVQTSETAINAIGNGGVELYYNNSKKFETTSYGNLSAAQVRVASSNTASVAFSVGDVNTGFYNSGSHAIGYAAQGTQMWNIDSAGNLRLNDSVKAYFGTSNDLQIYHDGSNSYIQDTDQGNLFIEASAVLIRKNGTTENIAKFIQDGAVELYYDNSKKFETTSTGASVTGTLGISNALNVTGLTTLSDSLLMGDNVRAKFGAGSDLQIYHDGTHSYFVNNTGNLRIQNNGTVKTAQFEIDQIDFNDSANTEVRVRINGDGLSLVQDNDKIQLGASQDIQIYHDGSNSYIRENGTGSLYIDSNGNGVILRGIQGEDSIVCNTNGDVELYYDNSKKFETKSYGAIWIGQLAGLDDSKITFGNGDDLQIYHNGTHSIISNSTGSLFSLADSVIFKNNANNETLMTLAADGAVELYYNNSKKFETTSTGITVSGTEHKFTSGTSGDCVLILEADTDNNDENDIPIIKFRQDGGLDLSAIGTGQTGTASDNHLTLANSAANGGISFRTGTANGYTNAVERMRILAGGGLTFNGDTSTNNALSDYEQGTWTPTAFYGSGSFSAVNNAVCRYVKVGTLVHVSGRFSLTGGGSGELKIEGLPFAKGNPSNDGNSAGIQIYVEGAASNITNDICGLVLDATTVIFIRRSGTTSSGSDVAGLVDGGTTLLIGGTYTTFG